MADEEIPQEAVPKKKSKLPILIGLVLMFILAGAGFYATYSGLVFGAKEPAAHAAEVPAELRDFAFVPVDPLVISLGQAGHSSHLRFSAQLEVGKASQQDVSALMPRILDVLNGYLRAVRVTELEDPTALIRLRAQMLRRIQIVTGEGKVRDLLVTEFVLN